MVTKIQFLTVITVVMIDYILFVSKFVEFGEIAGIKFLWHDYIFVLRG